MVLENQTINALLKNSSKLYADRPALAFTGRTPLAYGEISAKATGLSELLFSRGIGKGDKVAILSQNMPNWGIAYLGITTLGGVVVPVLTDFHEKEIKNILTHCEAQALVISDRMGKKVKGSLPGPVHTVILADDLSIADRDRLQESGDITAEKKTGRQPHQRTKKKKGTDLSREKEIAGKENQREVKEEDLAALIYTSGTTGSSKGVMLTHGNIVSNAINTAGIQDVKETDRMLSILPLAHSYECTIGFLIPLMKGASVYYLDKPPSPAVLIPAMQEVKPTMILSVPLIIEKIYKMQVLPKLLPNAFMKRLFKITFFRRLLHRAAAKKLHRNFGGKLRFFGIGGAKLGAFTERFLCDGNFPYAIGYGLTETSPLLAGSPPSLTRCRSTGYSLPGQELKIDSTDPVNKEGEILARGPNVMKGYFKDPEKTREVFTDDGWFRTGDLGIMDADNYLYIKGRINNMIVGPGGENIHPEEIEEIINKEPLALESMVYKPNDKLVARIHPNYEDIEKEYSRVKKEEDESGMDDFVSKKLDEIKQTVNSEVNKFSRIDKIIEQKSPFEKTPTRKIKRYLYRDGKGQEERG